MTQWVLGKTVFNQGKRFSSCVNLAKQIKSQQTVMNKTRAQFL